MVVSNGPLGESDRLLWVVMITSAENRRWAEDVPLDEDYAAAGLPVPSLIRPVKIATIDAAVAKKLGRIDPDRLARAMQSVRAKL